VGALDGLVWPDLFGAAELLPIIVEEALEFEFPTPPPKILLPGPILDELSFF
jgi:hypothetical protein